MAELQITDTLLQQAALLDSILYEADKTTQPRRSGPQRYLFLTEPQDLRVWRPGDNVTLLCFTDNRALTFWSFVAEVKDDETFMLQTRSWNRQPSLADAFEQYMLTSLPGGGSLMLQHALLPPYFDLALIDAYGIPDYDASSAVSSHAMLRLKTAQRAWEARRGIDEAVLQTYDLLRPWAENSGLVSQAMGPLNASMLLTLVLAAADEYTTDIIDKFFNCFATRESIERALHSCFPGHYEAADMEHIAQEIRRSERPDLAWPEDLPAPAKHFKQDYEHYIEMRCRSWNNVSVAEIWDQLQQLAQTLRQSLSSSLDTRIWTTPFVPLTTTETNESIISLLLGLSAAPGIDVLDRAMLLATLEDFSQKHGSQLESNDYLVTIEVRGQSELAELAPVSVNEYLAQTQEMDVSNKPSPSGLPGTSEHRHKFRTGGQALSRLKWDPVHQSRYYEVGYIDRFDGLKWTAMQDWGKPVEDEDFIPEHRIQQFRRRGSGQIIWDRARKIDLTGHK